MPDHTRATCWLLTCTLLALTAAAHAADAAGVPFTVEDLVRLKRVSDPQVSPDGRQVAYVQRETDMDANKGRTSLWLLELNSPAAPPRRLTDVKANDSSPRWSADGATLYFLSNRSGTQQVWRLAVGGGEAQRVSDYPLEVGAFKVSPHGEHLALTMEVFPDCTTLACTRARLDARAKDKATGRLYERLFVRHWDSWSDGTRSHLFSAPLRKGVAAATPVDVSQGMDADIPSKPFGGDEDFDFSPDGKQLVFSARIAQRSEAWSTNFDLFQAPTDGSAAPANLTANNPAWD
ncbi:MAG TPA: S9 family peptidase, partial [Candidatus Dormibacteraeota bacterium]|nr:S9 family peptidase [Candidatus Dormibacteraeota bacterium]